jgi:hypothetical protein
MSEHVYLKDWTGNTGLNRLMYGSILLTEMWRLFKILDIGERNGQPYICDHWVPKCW